MPNVRPKILRLVYERAWGADVPRHLIDDVVTFDEYHALERIQYPGITRHTAARNSNIERFHKLADEIEQESRPPVRHPPSIELSRKPVLDLAKADVPEGTGKLILSRIKSLKGFAGLKRFADLESLVLVLCASDAVERAPAATELAALKLNECNGACLRSALSTTSAVSIDIFHPGEPTIDLRLLANSSKLTELRAGGALLRGIEHLRDKPLVELHLGGVTADGALQRTLAELAPRLTTLSLSSDTAFAPSALPDLARFASLRRFEVSMTGREHAAAWVDAAVAHPRIDFRFMVRDNKPAEPARAQVQEIYRGVDILLIQEPKRKPVHEVSGDLAAMVDGDGNNNDLEDALMAAASVAKKKVKFSSEADTFVAQAADVETLRWVIDTALDGAGTPSAGDALPSGGGAGSPRKGAGAVKAAPKRGPTRAASAKRGASPATRSKTKR
jgi:hypothetical protein